jgi:hypothetical protein
MNHEPIFPPDVEEPEEGSMRSDRNWKIDKHIPVALIAALAFQSGGALWWAATISGRIDVLERQATSAAPLSERMVKMETKFDAVADTLQEIKAILRQVPLRP